MKSYFFIPANKQEFLLKSSEIEASEIILDLEDAIHSKDLQYSLNNLRELSVNKFYWLRIPHNEETESVLNKVTPQGFHNYIIPKIKKIEDLLWYINYFENSSIPVDDLQLILLVENPAIVLILDQILNYNQVIGIGIGSHDYCSEIGMQHTLENLYWLRMQVLNAGKAYNKQVIDIASMNINNEIEFREECIDTFSKGFDGKFIIHPWQLKIFNSSHQIPADELALAKKVKQYIDKIGGIENFKIVNIDGKVVEKPHLKRINEILDRSGYESF